MDSVGESTTLRDSDSFASFEKDNNTEVEKEYSNVSLIEFVSNYSRLTLNLERTDMKTSPFKLFKDMYSVLLLKQSHGTNKFEINLNQYFEFILSEIVYDKPTLTYDPNIQQFYLNIIPLVCLVHGNIKENISFLEKIKYQQEQIIANLKFLSRKSSLTKFNLWYHSIDSYIRIIFKDIISKWFQWTNLIIQNGGSYILNFKGKKSLQRKLCKKIWQDHFYLKNSYSCSLNQFKSYLKSSNKNKFGCWIDLQNNILIFATTTTNFQDNEKQKATAVCLTGKNVTNIGYLITIYINFAILYCFMANIE